MVKVHLAESAGFCFGVQRAVDTVYKILEREEKKAEKERLPIYTFGEIVHNETVVTKLKERGVGVLHEEAELRALRKGIVIIRAHGVGKHIYDILREHRVEIVDASCPYVQKIQRLARAHTKKVEKVLVLGTPSHPEIRGILGWADGDIRALPEIEDIERLPEGRGQELLVLEQTTFNIKKFKLIVDILKERGYHVSVINTICNATFERQTEARTMAAENDAMIVIGGSSSSNTRKLFEICRAECRNTQLIQTVKDLQFPSDEAIRNVGITAGASTPKEIIEEVLTYVRNEF